MSERIALRLPSDLKYLEVIYSLIKAISNDCGLDRRKFNHLQVAVSEGYTNAVIHGNQRCRDRYVVLAFERNPSFLSISIEDEGVMPIVIDTDHNETAANPLVETGRGLALIESLSGSFELQRKQPGGNVLRMTFPLDRNLEKY
jgi:serine/threonine-protein kinase RsbW